MLPIVIKMLPGSQGLALGFPLLCTACRTDWGSILSVALEFVLPCYCDCVTGWTWLWNSVHYIGPVLFFGGVEPHEEETKTLSSCFYQSRELMGSK